MKKPIEIHEVAIYFANFKLPPITVGKCPMCFGRGSRDYWSQGKGRWPKNPHAVQHTDPKNPNYVWWTVAEAQTCLCEGSGIEKYTPWHLLNMCVGRSEFWESRPSRHQVLCDNLVVLSDQLQEAGHPAGLILAKLLIEDLGPEEVEEIRWFNHCCSKDRDLKEWGGTVWAPRKTNIGDYVEFDGQLLQVVDPPGFVDKKNKRKNAIVRVIKTPPPNLKRPLPQVIPAYSTADWDRHQEESWKYRGFYQGDLLASFEQRKPFSRAVAQIPRKYLYERLKERMGVDPSLRKL